MSSREVMQQALDALEYYRSAEDVHGTPAYYAITALETELAKPTELLDQTSLRAVLGGIGNEVHNLACDHNRDEKLSNRLSEIAVNLWDVAKRASAKPAPVAVPEGWQLVPKELTAENGAKAALIGDFFVVQEINCPECDADEHDVGACSMCHGEGFVRNNIPVPWVTIKQLWRRAIEHFAAAPQPPAPAVDVEAVREVMRKMRDVGSDEEMSRGEIYLWADQLARAIGDET